MKYPLFGQPVRENIYDNHSADVYHLIGDVELTPEQVDSTEKNRLFYRNTHGQFCGQGTFVLVRDPKTNMGIGYALIKA